MNIFRIDLIRVRRTSEKGFFLIEASVALLIITTVLFAAIPAWILVQEELESTHQKAVSLVAVQNEMASFAHYLEEVGVREIFLDRYVFQVYWTIHERDNVEEGRLSISWVAASGKNEQTHYLLLRPPADAGSINEERP